MPEDDIKYEDMAPKQKTAPQERDEFVQHLIDTLDGPTLALTLSTADKLLELVTKPNMLNAFALANAELAALYFEGKLEAPRVMTLSQKIVVVPK